MQELTEQIQNEIKKAIIGKDDVIRKVLMAVLAQGHILLEDIPGVGKTTLAMAFARALGLDSRRIQFTSDTLPSDIIGFSVYEKESGKLQYKSGAIMTNLLLADEINRTSSKTQSALLEAMEEHQVTVDGVTHPLPDPFVVLATQNPVGSAGTQLLPSAQLDRFLMRLSMGYPDRDSQVALMKERHHSNPLDQLKAVVDIPELRKLIVDTAEVYVADEIYGYVTDPCGGKSSSGIHSAGCPAPRCAGGMPDCESQCIFERQRLCAAGRCRRSIFIRMCTSTGSVRKGAAS